MFQKSEIKMFFSCYHKIFVIFVAILLLTGICYAQTPGQNIFQLQKKQELKIIGTGLALLAVGNWLYFHSSGPDPTTLKLENVWRPERFAVKLSNHKTAEFSDITGGFCLILPLLTGLDTDFKQYQKDMLMYFESALVTQGIIELTKNSFKRPRPFAYRAEDDAHLSRNAGRSFISGHTAAAFQGAVFAAGVFQKRHPDSPLVMPVWALAIASASATAVFRVTSGNHFPTDVLAGAAVGSLIGWLIPKLHLGNSINTGWSDQPGMLSYYYCF